MASNRIGRINDEIRRELSDILRTVKDPRVSQAMVTITHVDTTSDLRYARIYVTALDRTGEKDLMRGLKSASVILRKIGGFMESATATSTPEPPDPPEESRCKVIPFEKVG